MAQPRVPRPFPLLMACLSLLAAACSGQAATATPNRTAPARASGLAASSRTVTVDATGKARAVPDQLVARLTVHTGGPTAAGVLSDANLRTQAVLDQAKRQGVKPNDMQTVQVNLGPTFDKSGNVTGWAADNALVIAFSRLSIAGRQLDAIVRTPGDAARLETVSLGFNDNDKLLARARTDAVRRARAQAEEMLGALGSDLGRVRTVTESSPGPVFDQRAKAASLSPVDASVPIAPGTQQLTVSVRVVFEID